MDSKKVRASRKTPLEQPPAAAQESRPPAAAPVRTPIDWRRHGLVALVLCTVLLAGYSNCFRSGLVYDNKKILQDDPRIRAVTPETTDAIWSKGYWYESQDPTLYRPLTTFSYRFNYAVLGDGLNPAGYHVVNLLLHVINVLLVYALGLAIFRKTMPAASFAALWGLHPVLTESVTNIVGRADLLSGFGVLAGLLCHIHAASATGMRRIGWLAGLAVAAGVGIYSKENGVVLVAVMLAYDLIFRRAVLRSCLPGFAAAGIAFACYFYLRAEVLAGQPAVTPSVVNNPLLIAGFWSGRLTAIQVLGRYLALLVWPQYLAADHSYRQIPIFRGTFDNWGDWATILSLAVCLAAAAAAWISRLRRPPVVFFITLLFLALAPVSNIAFLLVTIMAERFLYLPSIGFAGCLVWALYALAERLSLRWPAATNRAIWVVGLLCVALLLRTHARNADWESELTLWTSGVEAAPNNYKTHMNLAAADFALGTSHLDAALAEDWRSLAILRTLPPPDEDPIAFADAGGHLRAKGDELRKAGTPEAERQSREWYLKSLEVLQEGVPVDHGHSEAAIQANRAIGKEVSFLGWYRLYQELGQTYLRLDQPQKALEALEYGAMIQPSFEMLKLMSLAYQAEHDRDNAAIMLMEGVILYPGQKGFVSELRQLYETQDPTGCAVQRTATGVSLNLGCPSVHAHLCGGAARLMDYFTKRRQPADVAKIRGMAVQSMGCGVQ